MPLDWVPPRWRCRASRFWKPSAAAGGAKSSPGVQEVPWPHPLVIAGTLPDSPPSALLAELPLAALPLAELPLLELPLVALPLPEPPLLAVLLVPESLLQATSAAPRIHAAIQESAATLGLPSRVMPKVLGGAAHKTSGEERSMGSCDIGVSPDPKAITGRRIFFNSRSSPQSRRDLPRRAARDRGTSSCCSFFARRSTEELSTRDGSVAETGRTCRNRLRARVNWRLLCVIWCWPSFPSRHRLPTTEKRSAMRLSDQHLPRSVGSKNRASSALRRLPRLAGAISLSGCRLRRQCIADSRLLRDDGQRRRDRLRQSRREQLR